MNKKKTFFSVFYMGFVYLLLYAPILVMIVFSFNSAKSTTSFEGFSFKWYLELFHKPDVIEALLNTLLLAFLSALIATVIGLVASIGIYGIRNRHLRSGVMLVTNIPMMNPDIVTGVSLMLLFVFIGRVIGFAGDSLSFVTLLIAHITFNIPYVILNIMPKFNQLDNSIVEAATDLGCTPAQAFFKVIFPEIMPGVFSGALMSFTLSLDDFVISYFTNGADFQTLPLYIYSITKKNVKPDIYALSTIIFVVILLLLLVNALHSKSDKTNIIRKN